MATLLDEYGSLEASNDIELHQHVRTVMRCLQPHVAAGFEKRRFGTEGDGGYVCIDDFEEIDTALSFGIRDDVSWDLDVADRGLIVHQFDHTVDAPLQDPRLKFNRTKIAAYASDGCETIGSLVERFDKKRQKPNLILKMDIDDDEWPVLDAVESHHLARFSQIACELHQFEQLIDLNWRNRTYRALRKLTKSYAVVHVHGNNFAPTSVVANVFVPTVLEVTFANRAVYNLNSTEELFPGPLDYRCNPDIPDIFLGAFRF